MTVHVFHSTKTTWPRCLCSYVRASVRLSVISFIVRLSPATLQRSHNTWGFADLIRVVKLEAPKTSGQKRGATLRLYLFSLPRFTSPNPSGSSFFPCYQRGAIFWALSPLRSPTPTADRYIVLFIIVCQGDPLQFYFPANSRRLVFGFYFISIRPNDPPRSGAQTNQQPKKRGDLYRNK